MGLASSNVCQHSLDILMQTCNKLAIPLAEEKLESPSTSITFLGIVIDTSKSEIRLPEEKLQRTHQEVASLLRRNKPTKRKILSLVGLLQHATKVIKSHMYICSSSQGKGTELLHKTRPGV